MSSTENLNLPLVLAAQAQKHVTVNEALWKLDALTHLTLTGRNETTPPLPVVDGNVYSIPSGASGLWQDNIGDLAIGINGGWVFATPSLGWRGWDVETDQYVQFDGNDWQGEGNFAGGNGASTRFETISFEHVVTVGTSNTTSISVPSYSIVLGVTGRVTSEITGTGLTSWSLGIAGSTDRYGTGYGLDLNSYAKGLTSHPLAYWSDTPLEITPDAGSFSGGSIAFAVHIVGLTEPGAV